MSDRPKREPLKPGRGTYEIKEVDLHYVSKSSGNKMKKVSLFVTDMDGNRGMIWEYFGDKMLWKWITLLDGLAEKGDFSPYMESYGDIIGLVGDCTIKIEKSTNPAYPDDSERIDKFLPYTKKASKLKAHLATLDTGNTFHDDEIPF